eukprot:CAMPEP_0197703074 /NCGR_PEP_ID=MMETSP1338-20131121/125251_1 /TAXON_ID=43686 ORGANISM="Pelagodinium beii, Strain RCC1491" /NCGR_SAMPLE_ID=MMETSP1338 /ASSEMBLY_ACC=CAM_ASM_000754 /LENGTH=515 /DNA_ID=CAMNT_0043286967 /DNA_START=122 /DNA_END=1669 /DNA_ORIENTATION=+
MPELPLDQRLAFCRKLNLGICITQVMSSFLAITRWLHFGNVNGFRYLGYSVTCSFLQAELVILIAPYVPLFKTNVIGVMLITFSTMIAGWVGSLEPGWLYEDGSLENFAQSWDLQDILWTAKGYKVMPAWICLGLLIFIQIPVLALIFVCKSGLKPHRDLPFHYLRLLLLVELTWPCFGIWWFLSSEGEGVIHDTKANTITFSTMIAGWVGSLESGWLYEDGSLENFVQSWDVQDILWTEKGYKVMAAWICLGFLIFIQIPLLALIFVCKSGLKAHRDLPFHYLRLLLLVQLTWPCFGIWWFLSSEGEGIIHDTKANTFGFCLLNIISKGGFTLTMLKLSRDHRSMWIEDCAVTPKAKNEDLWIVRHFRPYDYDPASNSREKKYSDSELDAAVTRALARHGIGAVQDANEFAPNPFGLPQGSRQISDKSREDPEAKDAPEMDAAEFSVSKSKSLMASSEALAVPALPVLLPTGHTQALNEAPAPVPSGQDSWLCSCDRKPPVNVQTVEEPMLFRN